MVFLKRENKIHSGAGIEPDFFYLESIALITNSSFGLNMFIMCVTNNTQTYKAITILMVFHASLDKAYGQMYLFILMINNNNTV